MFRKFLLSTVALVAVSATALAADLPSRAEPPAYIPPPAVFSWTGIYIGGQVGYEWGNDNLQELHSYNQAPDGFYQPFTTDGIVGGAHLGYNYQMGIFVAGAEVDVNGTSNRGGYTLANGNGATSREDVEGSLRGRAGLAFDRALIFATAGGVIASINDTYVNSANVAEPFNNGRAGWTVGGGVDYAITNNWSVGIEYRYIDFVTYENVSVIAFPGYSYRQNPRENEVLASFSYKFGEPPPPAPVIAKY